MTPGNIEDLLLNAADNATGENLRHLLSCLRQHPDIRIETVADGIDLLLESWDTMNRDGADFCLGLAALDCRDSAVFRKVLTDAVKFLLPPYLNKLGFIRALGLRNNDIDLKTIVARYHNLTRLKVGLVVFLEDSARWGKITGVDGISSSVAISSLSGDGALAVPLANALDNGVLFESDAETLRLTDNSGNALTDGEAFRALLNRKAISPPDTATARQIAFKTLVPSIVKADRFDAWWAAEKADAVSSRERSSADARSLHELHILLAQEASTPELPPYSGDDCEKYASLLARAKPGASVEDARMLAEIVSMLAERGNDEQLRQIVGPLKAGVPFWPDNPVASELKLLDTWGTLKADHLERLGRTTSIAFSPEYLAALATRLPLRALNYLCDYVDVKILAERVLDQRTPVSDILLWLWKNRGKYDNIELRQLFNIDTVVRTLAVENLPRAWSGARRELKKLLMDSSELHGLIVDIASNSISRITSAIHTANFLTPGEKQSLLIKLARQSPELRQHLERGTGHKLVGATHDTQPEKNTGSTPLFTSPESLRKLRQELADITKIHIPENRASLQAARAHGDFRENSEYDAAKERRDFLSRRRSELEHDIALIQPLDFSRITATDTVVVGCQVHLATGQEQEETFFLLGAWDGNPEKKHISYKSPLGASLLGRRLGEQIRLPGNKTALISKISPLPLKLIRELAGGD